MSNDQSPMSPVFRIDVSTDSSATDASLGRSDIVQIELLRQLVAGQQRQNELLAELTQFTAGMHKQRAAELQQWKDANPGLAKACRRAAETLNRVQTRFLESITEEVDDNAEHLEDGDFMLHEFVDRFGPRLAHLNGVLQVLAQLSDTGNNTARPKS
jgi:predicted DsbA family dithiol-disulfide isomerase